MAMAQSGSPAASFGNHSGIHSRGNAKGGSRSFDLVGLLGRKDCAGTDKHFGNRGSDCADRIQCGGGAQGEFYAGYSTGQKGASQRGCVGGVLKNEDGDDPTMEKLLVQGIWG